MNMNENSFNDWENTDFFRKHLDNMDMSRYLDDNGDFDFEKLKEESFKLVEEMTGKKVEDFFDGDFIKIDKSFPTLSNDKIGLGFTQDLDDEDGINMFDSLVKLHNLTKESNITTLNGTKHIEEIWSNNTNGVRLTRTYPLTDETSNMLSTGEQIKLYNEKLEEAVRIEDYEEAVTLRDIINNLKNA